MWTELLNDFEGRLHTPERRPLTALVAFIRQHPEQAATALRLARAWAPLWQRAGGAPPPLTAEELNLEALSAEARAEAAALLVDPLPTGATDLPGTGWREAFIGGSPEAEARHYAHIAEQVRAMQDLGSTDGRARRAFHAKGLGLQARFTVASRLPPELQVGLFVPGRVWPAVVRLSNAGSPDDDQPNLHGLAVRIFSESKDNSDLVAALAQGSGQDFLATSAPVSHVADAADQAVVGEALAHGTLKGALKLLRRRGLGFTVRVLKTLSQQTRQRAASLATLAYYSRAPFRFGPVAARFRFVPLDATAPTGTYQGAHRLVAELTDRLKAGPVRWAFELQRFVDEQRTPIEQGDAAWDVPGEIIGTLEIPAHDLDAPAAEALARAVEAAAFSPFTTRHHTPLGRLNRGRGVAYAASVDHRK